PKLRIMGFGNVFGSGLYFFTIFLLVPAWTCGPLWAQRNLNDLFVDSLNWEKLLKGGLRICDCLPYFHC
ncbi:uncharacterized protein METZ01_LOCUS288594, partial [marine metagenome]